jgi:hypothetical protein
MSEQTVTDHPRYVTAEIANALVTDFDRYEGRKSWVEAFARDVARRCQKTTVNWRLSAANSSALFSIRSAHIKPV